MPAVPPRSSLPPMDVASRLERLRESLGEVRLLPGAPRSAVAGSVPRRAPAAGGPTSSRAPAVVACDALLVTSPVNIRYLTGFSGSAAMLLVTRSDKAVLLTDGRYREQAAEQLVANGLDLEVWVGRVAEQLDDLARRVAGLGRVGLEADAVTWADERRVAGALDSLDGAGVELVPTRGVVERLRAVKDEGELARTEMAADIADVALAQVKSRLAERPTEIEFAVELDYEMRRRGADDVAFRTIVGSGPNAALPHAEPSGRCIEPGELVVVDFGALVDGYRSDMTRTLCVGGVPAGEMADVLDAVLLAQRAGVRSLAVGSRAEDVDRACRESLDEAGYLEGFVHGTGHGIGLEVHESPAVSQGSEDVLEAGTVVTVEPGVYVPGVGGARIEDTLLVTAGGARALTKSTKDSTI